MGELEYESMETWMYGCMGIVTKNDAVASNK